MKNSTHVPENHKEKHADSTWPTWLVPLIFMSVCVYMYRCYYRFPEGLEDVSKYPALIEELISRNWSEEELAGVLRLNFLRVFQEAEKVWK